jgi:ribosomal protein L2
MGLKKFRPITQTTRFKTVLDFSEITESTPHKPLTKGKKENAGRGNKGKVSATRLPAAKVERIAGSFRLVPLTAETWPKLFADFFGPPRPATPTIDAPYLASYDTQ